MPAFDRARSLAAAEKFVKAGKMPEAIAEYKKLADDNPRDMNVVNKLGDLLVRAGKVPDALRQFLRIADFYARDGFFLKAIAMLATLAGDAKVGINDLRPLLRPPQVVGPLGESILIALTLLMLFHLFR